MEGKVEEGLSRIAEALIGLADLIATSTAVADETLWIKILSDSQELKNDAIQNGTDLEANRAWFLTETASCWRRYLSVFNKMRAMDYYNSWCDLERLEISLMWLTKNLFEDPDRLGLQFLVRQVAGFQSLFPYGIFFSPEIIVGHEVCSICGTKINPWRVCQHEIGRVYRGRLCYREARDVTLVSISAVRNPVQKYSVGFTTDGNGETVDQHDYSAVRFVTDRLRSALDGFETRWTKAYHPHELFRQVSDFDLCPCESGESYGECCRKLPGVLRRHLAIDFEKEPSSELPSFELMGYDGVGSFTASKGRPW
jgi:hypothetical protein